MIDFAKVQTAFFPFGGGLDLTTPTIAMPPGRAIDAQNYVPEVSGGYSRIDGFERFDGHPSPTRAGTYQLLPITPVANQAIALPGITVKGATSNATGRLLATVPGSYLLGRVVGTFQVGENIVLFGTGTVLATCASLMSQAATADDDADYRLLAANDLRQDIAFVPGSGPIRGVFVLNDVVYAFRDNVGGTGSNLYKSTTGGWSQVTFGYELQFKSGTAAINVGDTVTNGAGASGVVTGVKIRTGAWGSNAAGSLFFTAVTGTFALNGPIQVGGVQKATAASSSNQIMRNPGGRLEAVSYNFTGSTTTQYIYGVDGVNRAFQFDGSNYWPINTGMAADIPRHVACYKNMLFLSFEGSLQNSSPGDPFGWAVILGASEIATGDRITALLPMGGDQGSSAMAVFTNNRMHVLYGSSSLNFQLQTSIADIGFTPYTVQSVSNTAFGMARRGIQSLVTTQAFGDFDSISISHQVQPLVTKVRGTETASITLHTKNQYRLYFANGTALVVGLTGDKVNGVMPLNYGKVVRCNWSSSWNDGQERAFFGSDDGFVYEENIGTSFDGEAIEAWLRLTFDHQKSPNLRKRYRRAVLEVAVAGFAKVNVSYDLGYGSTEVQPPAVMGDTVLQGSIGGYWDQFYWDQFNWDTQAVLSPAIQLEGTEKNLSLVFYSKRAQDAAHSLQGVTISWSARRQER